VSDVWTGLRGVELKFDFTKLSSVCSINIFVFITKPTSRVLRVCLLFCIYMLQQVDLTVVLLKFLIAYVMYSYRTLTALCCKPT